jgi:polar amino acid transport system ATP-binding protein
MRDLAAEGMTMVVVTHEIAFAAEVADRMVFMDKGEILESGKPELVMNSGKVRVKEFFDKVIG